MLDEDKIAASGALEIPCHFCRLTKRNDTCEKNLILMRRWVSELPKPLYDDYSQVPASVAKLALLDFDAIADGHVGLHKNGNSLLAAYVAAHE
jgi:hypothetical protein